LYLKRKVLKTKERNNKTIEIENPKGFILDNFRLNASDWINNLFHQSVSYLNVHILILFGLLQTWAYNHAGQNLSLQLKPTILAVLSFDLNLTIPTFKTFLKIASFIRQRRIFIGGWIRKSFKSLISTKEKLFLIYTKLKGRKVTIRTFGTTIVFQHFYGFLDDKYCKKVMKSRNKKYNWNRND